MKKQNVSIIFYTLNTTQLFLDIVELIKKSETFDNKEKIECGKVDVRKKIILKNVSLDNKTKQIRALRRWRMKIVFEFD